MTPTQHLPTHVRSVAGMRAPNYDDDFSIGVFHIGAGEMVTISVNRGCEVSIAATRGGALDMSGTYTAKVFELEGKNSVRMLPMVEITNKPMLPQREPARCECGSKVSWYERRRLGRLQRWRGQR